MGKISSQKQLTKIAKYAIGKGYDNVKLKVSGKNKYTFEASNNSSKDKTPKKADKFQYFLTILEMVKKVLSYLTFFSDK